MKSLFFGVECIVDHFLSSMDVLKSVNCLSRSVKIETDLLFIGIYYECLYRIISCLICLHKENVFWTGRNTFEFLETTHYSTFLLSFLVRDASVTQAYLWTMYLIRRPFSWNWVDSISDLPSL